MLEKDNGIQWYVRWFVERLCFDCRVVREGLAKIARLVRVSCGKVHARQRIVYRHATLLRERVVDKVTVGVNALDVSDE